MTKIYDLCDAYVDDYTALDPIAATEIGVAGLEHLLTDLSPDGHRARVALARDTVARIDAETPTSDRDRIAASVIKDRLGVAIAIFDLGEPWRDLRTLGSDMQAVREVFDLMARDTDDDWHTIATRMRAVPDALDGFRASLDYGRSEGIVAPERQAEVCARQAETWGGQLGGATPPFFLAVAAEYTAGGALREELDRSARIATDAYAMLAKYIRDEYLPGADPRDAVGAERYAVFARGHCGAQLDLLDTYAWGWDELRRIERAIEQCCNRIEPGADFATAVARLEADPSRVIEGEDALLGWIQDRIDRTISELNGTHFDIAEPLQRCQAMIAPPGGAAAMYYTGPSEDFSRPGRTWYPTLGNTRFPTWREVSICYHESVPGHHLQIGQVRYLSGVLSRYQRMMGFVSGHGEGWALYAERLMGELGYLEDPGYELGMLAAQAMRAVRVIVDIGMHLELAVPDDEPGIGGQTWTPELALPFVIERSRFPENFMRSEVNRYLGLPGQAITYKVGERVWLEARDAAKARHGAAFDLKAWHAFALDLGATGLDDLTRELARF
ncbi:MAG TPA: DUF885 domain-containing protein [Acidimicrobiia bacterium]